jgi:3-oxoacyl-[acyl-carrier-protein] synthase-3
MTTYIKAIEYFLPEGELSNEMLASQFTDWSPQKIEVKTGIRTRHIANAGECASDLGVMAARKIFESGTILPAEIDFLLFCTESPDYILPPSACLIQNQLGIPTSSGALDFNLGCSGFVYGMGLAHSLIMSEQASNVLLITSETYSKHIHFEDRSVRSIFGDGAAATVISACQAGTENKIGPFVYGTDGKGYNNLIVPCGGMRNPLKKEALIEKKDRTGNVRTQKNLYMNGPEIFNFTIKTVPAAVKNILKKSGKKMENVDFFVFHQANAYMLSHLQKKIGIPDHKFYINMYECGNTVSASIPIALKMALNEKKISSGDLVMVVGFGVGYSWAASFIEWI